MKRVLLYLLSTLMLIQACWGIMIISAFYINRDYIAQYLCENRDAPQLQCQGTCVLMKKMKKAREDEKKNTENKIKESHVFVVAPVAVLAFPSYQSNAVVKANFDMRKSHYTFDRVHRILRPPSC